MKNLVKFSKTTLNGYGFDISADRVVRFGKHVDGAYMNTRATYSINRQRYTHFELREIAVNEPPVKHSVPSMSFVQQIKWWVIAIVIVIVFSTVDWSFSVNTTIHESDPKTSFSTLPKT